MTRRADECWQHRTALINGLDLHFVEAGTGELVLLLHGFPEFWYAWRRQIPVLAEAGFHVIAPDLRGYNESAKPAGLHNYRLQLLEDDAVGLIRHAGVEQAVLVGHDWGGAVAWNLAMHRPELVRRLVILNSPHPAAFRRELRGLEQCLRSWYILLFCVPWLGEGFVRAGRYRSLAQTWRRMPDAFTEEDIERYVEALERPGALTAALNYYRAALRHGAQREKVRRIDAPTLLIWGEQDVYLSPRLTHGLEAWVSDLRVELLPHASHWVQNEAAEAVNRLLLEFLL